MRGSRPRRAMRSAFTRRMAAACITGPDSIAGAVYITLEKILKARTDLFLFESEYIRDLFNRRIGAPRAMVRVVHNGVAEREFAEVAAGTVRDRSSLHRRTSRASKA